MTESDDNTVKQAIEAHLTKALAPHFLEVKDVSWQHAGHAGAHPGGQSHFEVVIAAQRLSGLSRVAGHRAVNQALADLLEGPIHALQITIKRD